MTGLLQDPAIVALLEDADNTRALVTQVGTGTDAELALAGIYQDLGRAVHLRMIASGASRPPARRRMAVATWEDDDDEEPTLVDRPAEDEDAGLITRIRRRQ